MSGASSANRNLPSWTSSKEGGSTSHGKKQGDALSEFSKLLEGVVFVLSGFVNPERSTLRSQALEMGAEYKPDWNPDCTLLVCAFPNTPKFRQVQSDGGTIISKEWISECYSQKKLVEIERFLMHAGKPWRKNSNQLESKKGQNEGSREKPRKQAEKKSPEKPSKSSMAKVGTSDELKGDFLPSQLKEWAIDDLNKTVSWLESQEEKPEASEIRAIAAQGIITCLQDTIESLKESKDIRLVMDQWMFVPCVVKELAELESGGSGRSAVSKEGLIELANTCKRVYEGEFAKLDGSPKKNGKRKASCAVEDGVSSGISPDDAGFDSDQTIEMTEEEIELACNALSA